MKAKQQKELAERRFNFRQWKRSRRGRLEAQALLAFLKTMTGPGALIDFAKAGPWHDADVRFEILALVDAAIISHRERMGLAPFEDALPGQPENVFLILRQRLVASHYSPSPSDDGAARGAARFDQTSNPPKHELYHDHSNSN